MRLQEFLSSKPLFYKKFDPTRMPRAYELIKPHLKTPPIIHIIGTNGKGTTGRFLAGMLKEAGFKVGHYTSPHILEFRERIWIYGEDANWHYLEQMHQRLQRLLPLKVLQELSYFEYTTFLAILAFEGLDFVVLEAGLGGEYDATSVFENILTLVTPIDFDHKEFLGKSIEAIATTKLKAVQKEALLASQKHPEVEKVAKKLGIAYEIVNVPKEYEKLVASEGLAPFFAINLALAEAGAKKLGIEVDIKKALQYRLRGRAQRVGNVILDVGHNPLAARALEKIIDKETILVYNTYEDKDYRAILEIFKPKIKEVQILPVENERIVERDSLQKALQDLQIPYKEFSAIKSDQNYLVFGSFSVVEEFLRRCGQSFMSI